MRLAREPFSWEGIDDLPVPLPNPGGAADDEAPPPRFHEAATAMRHPEEPVRLEERETSLSATQGLQEVTVGRGTSWESLRGPLWCPLPIRLRAVLVAAGCVIAFAHGWGTAAHSKSPPGKCDLDHCGRHSLSSHWKEEQYL